MSDFFQIEPHKDLHFISAWQPLFGGRLPFCESETACFTVPGYRFIMDEFAIAIPKRGPLRLRRHLIVSENRAHICDRILKNGRGREFVKVIAVERKLKWAEHSIGVRSYDAFE